MEQFLKVAGLVIGVIAGLLGLLKTILEIRKQVREDKSLPTLVAGPQFRIGAILTFIGLAVLIGSVWWLSRPRPATDLIVQIWDVVLDEKHAIMASRQFTGFSGSSLSEDELQQVGVWLAEQVGREYDLNAEEIQLSVYVPGDPGNEIEIEAAPAGRVDVYYWTVVSDRKSRLPLSNGQALPPLDQDFFLEFSRPGYEAKVIQVTWGQELNRDLSMQPRPVRIGIEQFEGERNSIATQLAHYLSANPRLSITDPDRLAVLKEEIAVNEANLAQNPMIQQTLRTSLGLDLIVTGVYEGP